MHSIPKDLLDKIAALNLPADYGYRLMPVGGCITHEIHIVGGCPDPKELDPVRGGEFVRFTNDDQEVLIVANLGQALSDTAFLILPPGKSEWIQLRDTLNQGDEQKYQVMRFNVYGEIKDACPGASGDEPKMIVGG